MGCPACIAVEIASVRVISSAELGEKEGTQVAKVAGVLHAGSSYHEKAILEYNAAELITRTEAISTAMHAGQPIAGLLISIGRGARDRVKQQISREGHVDSGRLLRTTQFILTDRMGKYLAAKERAEKRAARKARRRV